MKIGDRVRVRLSPHLEGDPIRTWSYIGSWWHTAIVTAIVPSDPWPVRVRWVEGPLPPFDGGVWLYRSDELEVL